jgi:hypothetical protein
VANGRGEQQFALKLQLLEWLSATTRFEPRQVISQTKSN